MFIPTPDTDDIQPDGTSRRAAAYVRMSTDHQQYSIEHQTQVILDYAQSHGIEIVRTYADTARSGLTLQGRDEMRQLIADALGGRANFSLVLVYDVSRWGRFQDVDESAHYEFICRKAGLRVEYCADGFRNDGSMTAILMKGMKRAMAGEFSRELSAKVFEGHTRLVRLGFHQGGTAGFGLRRILVDHKRRPKGFLRAGEEKNLQSDRVILAPGPPDEVETVRDIFRLYVHERLSHRQIARTLNQKGIRNGRGNVWTQHNISLVLRSERYIGALVYNRTSIKLQSKRIFHPNSKWIRCEGAIAPIVATDLFKAAQKRLSVSHEIGDNDLLNHLTAVWCVKGYLSCQNMETVVHSPVSNTYQQRFGSLENAYRLIGYRRTCNYRYAKVGPLLCRVERDLICRLASGARQRGLTLQVESATHLVRIGGIGSVATVMLPFSKKRNHGRPGWWLHYTRIAKADFLLVARLTQSNIQLLDCYLLPFPLLAGPTFRFTAENIVGLASCRLNTWDDFWDLLHCGVPREQIGPCR